MKFNKTEVLAGISSFLATVYIVAVNPAILSQAGMPFGAVVTSTVLVSFLGSLMMGWYAKNPIIVAPGMGMNAFFTFTAVKYMGLTYQEALGAVFWSGVFFMLISVFNFREAVLKAIPENVRKGVSVGIGLFICFVGLQNAHIVVDNSATLVGLRSLNDPLSITFFVGLFFTAILVLKNKPGALIVGIALTTILCLPIGRWWGDASAVSFGKPTIVNYAGLFAWPDFSLVFEADFIGSLKFSYIPVIFAFAFTDMFDGISTLVGLSEASGLKDPNGNPKNLRQSLVTDAFSTLVAGVTGSSPGTAYIESAVGIQQGGRTGQTAIVAAFLFLPLMFMSPLVSLIPATASSIALVLVGAFMMEPVKDLKWNNLEEALPAFIALSFIPFSYSITQGIVFGLLSFTLIKIFLGKMSEVSPVLIIINILSIIALCL
jgi:AGZA family xanthine/uracil permease-like MFS transporter